MGWHFRVRGRKADALMRPVLLDLPLQGQGHRLENAYPAYRASPTGGMGKEGIDGTKQLDKGRPKRDSLGRPHTARYPFGVAGRGWLVMSRRGPQWQVSAMWAGTQRIEGER